MKHKAISLIAGFIVCASSALAADFIEIKGAQDIDNIRIPLKSGSAYHSKIQALPNGESATGLYAGFALQAETSKKGIEASLVGNLFQGYIDFAAKDEEKKLSPVLKSFEKKFSIKKPGKEWTKVTVAKDTIYEVRWITE